MTGGFFKSLGGDRKYSDDDFSDYFSQFLSDGVFQNDGGGGFFVTANGEDRKLTVAAGHCFIGGRMGSCSGETLPALSFGGNGLRYDRIVIRCDYAERSIYLAVIEGEEGTGVPDVVRDGTYYDLGIAVVTVPASATAIEQADIEDTRMYDDVCGFVHGYADAISESWLFLQYKLEWAKFIAALGEDDHVTVDCIDYEGRELIAAVQAQGTVQDMTRFA